MTDDHTIRARILESVSDLVEEVGAITITREGSGAGIIYYEVSVLMVVSRPWSPHPIRRTFGMRRWRRDGLLEVPSADGWMPLSAATVAPFILSALS